MRQDGVDGATKQTSAQGFRNLNAEPVCKISPDFGSRCRDGGPLGPLPTRAVYRHLALTLAEGGMIVFLRCGPFNPGHDCTAPARGGTLAWGGDDARAAR